MLWYSYAGRNIFVIINEIIQKNFKNFKNFKLYKSIRRLLKFENGAVQSYDFHEYWTILRLSREILRFSKFVDCIEHI